MRKRCRVRIAARIALLAVFILTIIIAACTSIEKVEPVASVEIDESNNGEQIELALGEVLAVRLESNPSTGYVWEIDELDESVLRQIGEAVFELSVPDNPPPGTGGWVTYRFEAVGEGESELRLLYHQPWTKEAPLVIYAVQVGVH
jgi:inhibitor of cysteine peptidase